MLNFCIIVCVCVCMRGCAHACVCVNSSSYESISVLCKYCHFYSHNLREYNIVVLKYLHKVSSILHTYFKLIVAGLTIHLFPLN